MTVTKLVEKQKQHFRAEELCAVLRKCVWQVLHEKKQIRFSLTTSDDKSMNFNKTLCIKMFFKFNVKMISV